MDKGCLARDDVCVLPPRPPDLGSHNYAAEQPAIFGTGSGNIMIVVLAHNEERRIAACLASLPPPDARIAVHVVVNGSSDRTAMIARRHSGAIVHEYVKGGKSRSWNRFVMDEAPEYHAPDEIEAIVLVDGDAVVLPGSVAALVQCLQNDHSLNAAAGMPMNGTNAARYRRDLHEHGGLFGDLYALSGRFVRNMRKSGIRLPLDLVGDDGMIAALAHTDLADDDNWSLARVAACDDAGFLAERFIPTAAGIRAQSGRMVNYSLRYFQNQIVRDIMRGPGPFALPDRLANLYPAYLPQFSARKHLLWWWFDRQALRRMELHSAALAPPLQE